jgi:hypothetical protein
MHKSLNGNLDFGHFVINFEEKPQSFPYKRFQDNSGQMPMFCQKYDKTTFLFVLTICYMNS